MFFLVNLFLNWVLLNGSRGKEDCLISSEFPALKNLGRSRGRESLKSYKLPISELLKTFFSNFSSEKCLISKY